KLVAPPGIVVGRVSSCKIYNNKFLDLLGPGIKFGKIGADILTIDISRNNFVNTNRSRVINNNFVLDLRGSGISKSIRIQHNIVENSLKEITPIQKPTKGANLILSQNLMNGISI